MTEAWPRWEMQFLYSMSHKDRHCTKASIYNMPKKQGQTIDLIALKGTTEALKRPSRSGSRTLHFVLNALSQLLDLFCLTNDLDREDTLVRPIYILFEFRCQ